VRKIGAAFLLLGVTAACTTVTPEGGDVRLTNNPDAVKGCQFLANINTVGWSSSEKAFRREVVKAGGNVGFITHIQGIRYIGEAYRCPSPPAR
jgi:hypothetical protein